MTTETIVRPKIQVNTELKEPSLFNVYIMDDNKTTFDFVMETLMTQYQQSYERAEEVTLSVHHDGRGLAGTFPFEIAETKASETHIAAVAAGFPLNASIEEA